MSDLKLCEQGCGSLISRYLESCAECAEKKELEEENTNLKKEVDRLNKGLDEAFSENEKIADKYLFVKTQLREANRRLERIEKWQHSVFDEMLHTAPEVKEEQKRRWSEEKGPVSEDWKTTNGEEDE